MFIIFNGHYLIQICHKWMFQKILGNFELVMNFGSFGQTMVWLEFVNSLWNFWVGSQWCFVVTMWCSITPSRASYDAIRRFWYGRSMFHKLMEPLNLSFCMNFLKISNEIGRACCKHHLACDCARLCQIWGHLNNAMLINGPRIANWG